MVPDSEWFLKEDPQTPGVLRTLHEGKAVPTGHWDLCLPTVELAPMTQNRWRVELLPVPPTNSIAALTGPRSLLCDGKTVPIEVWHPRASESIVQTSWT